MKNENLNKSNDYNPLWQFFMEFGFVQIVLCVIRACGGIADWPMTAVLLPSFCVIAALGLGVVVLFVLIVIALIARAIKIRKGGK